MTHTLAFSIPGGWEWIAILIVGLLLFGRRLPEVGHSIGKAIVEFKRGVRGIQDEIDEEASKPEAKPSTLPDGETQARTVARGEEVEQQAPPSAEPGTNPAS